jgi:hypothetical protein
MALADEMQKMFEDKYRIKNRETLASKFKKHFDTLPQQIEANQRAMDKTMAGMDKTDILGRVNPNYYPEAMQEFTQNYMPNVAGMMTGPASALWNKENAFKAAKMLKQGISEAEVFQATNTAKGLEGQFRQEISDVNSHIKGGPTFYDTVMNRMKALEKQGAEPMYAKDVFYHPEVYKAYPELQNIEIQFVPKGNQAKASYNPVKNVISINETLTPEQARSSMLHEMQHAVQEIEGFNKGADANKIIGYHVKHYDDLMGEIGDLNNQMSKAVGTPEYDYLMNRRMDLTKKVQALGDPLVEGSKVYQRYGGEAEARLTQTRRDLAHEQRLESYPFAQGRNALDINPKEAIIDTASVNEPINRIQAHENRFNSPIDLGLK